MTHPAPRPEPARRRALSFDSLWVQAAVAGLLSVLVVTWIAPAVLEATTAEPAPLEVPHMTTERPRGLVPIEEVMFMLRPAELGVPPWEPGQFAAYELATESERPLPGEDLVRRNVRIEIVREARPDDAYPALFGMPYPDLYWMRIRAIHAFRRQPEDLYRLVNPMDLSISEGTPAFTYKDDYIPFLLQRGFLPEDDTHIVRELGRETITVEAGEFDCRKLEIYLAAKEPGEEDELIGTLWANADVGPVGIVRLANSYESLTLRAFGTGGSAEYAEAMAPLIEGVSTFTGFCHACHGETHHDLVFPPH